MRRYAIRTFYDGLNYHGYQRQPDRRTIEGTLIEALVNTGYIDSPENNKFRSASRTDRYVSSIGNVFAFSSEENIILDQLNAALPNDHSIICWSLANVSDDFTPKHSRSKKYWYVLPLKYIKTTTNMDLKEIRELCSYFKGEHDFRLFCKLDYRDTKRRIDEFNFIVKESLVIFEIQASSFLWEQVRRIISYILNYNKLSESLKNIENLLQTKTQIKVLNIEPANPKQLILLEHFYENINWESSEKAIKNIIDRSYNVLTRLQQEEFLVSSIFEYFDLKKPL